MRSLFPRALFARGEGGGSGASSPQASWLLHLTEVWIKCNSEQVLGAVSIQ